MKSFPTPKVTNSREHDENWCALIDHIPALKFNPNWSVKIIPPFRGAVVRFFIDDDSGAHASVYLDTASILGCSDEIYWEIYPDEFGETARFRMEDGDGLMNAIYASMASQRKANHGV